MFLCTFPCFEHARKQKDIFPLLQIPLFETKFLYTEPVKAFTSLDHFKPPLFPPIPFSFHKLNNLQRQRNTAQTSGQLNASQRCKLTKTALPPGTSERTLNELSERNHMWKQHIFKLPIETMREKNHLLEQGAYKMEGN